MAKKSAPKKRKAPAKKKVVKKVKKVKKTAKKVTKKPAKKKAVKKVAKKKAIKKVAPKKKAPKKIELAKKPYTKTEMYNVIADHVGITKKQVGHVFEVLADIIKHHIKKEATGLIKLEGLLKIERIHKPAKKARKGINPFTGEEMMFKAKPAHYVVKVKALKKLKEMI